MKWKRRTVGHGRCARNHGGSVVLTLAGLQKCKRIPSLGIRFSIHFFLELLFYCFFVHACHYWEKTSMVHSRAWTLVAGSHDLDIGTHWDDLDIQDLMASWMGGTFRELHVGWLGFHH